TAAGGGRASAPLPLPRTPDRGSALLGKGPVPGAALRAGGAVSLSILGLGTALPAHTVSQSLASEVAQKLAGSDEGSFSALYRKSGVVTRHMVLPPEVVMDWLFSGSGGDALGPTTGERMRL